MLDTENDSPLLVVQNTATKEVRRLHWNMLFPLRLVDPDDHQQVDTTPILVKANILMETEFFTCDCKNCMEPVLNGGGDEGDTPH